MGLPPILFSLSRAGPLAPTGGVLPDKIGQAWAGVYVEYFFMNGSCTTSDLLNGDFLVERPVTFARRDQAGQRAINVFPRHVLQRVDGFGGSFTEGSGVVYNAMPAPLKRQLLQWYFAADGNRYQLARMPIQSCDFSLGNYAYAASAADVDAGRLLFEHDYCNLMPMIRDALAINPEMTLMASPWSPPAFMKTNGDMNGGGALLPREYARWAELIARYLLEYRRNGIEIRWLSVQNEPVAVKPWESCLYSVQQETAFAVDFLRPALARHGLEGMEIYIWDHDKDGLADWAERAFASQENRVGIDGVAFHWYTGDHFAQLAHVAGRFPQKKMLFSEGCVPMESGQDSQLRHAERYLHDMIGNFKAGCTGSIDWNLLLDSHGGPNHQGNMCEAPVQYDVQRGVLRRNHSWYCIGHFSRYVRPGARAILSSCWDSRVEEVAFVNPDGERVLVAHNTYDQPASCRVIDGNLETEMILPAHSVCTLRWSQSE